MAEIADKQIKRLRSLLHEAETNVAAAKELLISLVGEEEAETTPATEQAGKVIEGVFDGQNMIGPDGKTFPVPANYASKSKLVQGDILKLTIAEDGTFIYKQIGPVPRQKVIGTVEQKGGQYFINVDDSEYRVLMASVTYFKAQPGDQVTAVIPEEENAEWAAIEAAITG
ncbi:hypothetical protein BRC19_03210 [Candidatus Saccharibacteria bacterium QS_5_54_17]|nr:MAG: hypothetical protein BRC19_03210 [Candidatus Saccharibacteria bacterium QS_5_54_17]